MLDPDISTEDAKRLLSIDDCVNPDDRTGLSRRRFLQMVGWGVGGGALLGGLGEAIAPDLLPGELRDAWAGNPIGANDGIVVLLGLDGGNDFANTFVPYTNSNYYAQRGSLAIPANQVLQITPTLGLNNRLPYLRSLYDRGEVAIVQGVGYPNPDLSHFTSMALWMYGKAGNGAPVNGWVGRWLDGRPESLFGAATVGSYLPLHLIGDVRRGTAIPPRGLGFGTSTRPEDLRMYDGVRSVASASSGRGALHDAVAAGMRGVIDVGQEVSPVFSRPTADTDLVRKMIVTARLINADLGLRVVDTSFGGFDTHSSQPGAHNELMLQLDAGLKAFFGALDDRFRSRVTILTYSEFGRTAFANDSEGTDHGTSGHMMVIGNAVKGGLYGQMPNLAGLSRWQTLQHHVDFRSLYASVIDGWLGGGASTVLGGSYPNLNLFKAGPGQGVATGSVPPTVLGDYVSLTPARAYDSRNGVGGRFLPLGAGTVAEVQITGAGGVPASGVTAVAINVVSVAATATTSFTVWPTGDPKPAVTNVRSDAARAVPNLVIVKLGKNGRINIANDLGEATCVADVVGYFSSGAGERLVSITPVRALDTRNGTGGRTGALGATQSFDLTVAGVNGVPPNATAVIINVTAVQPTAKGYATVWPTGVARPLAASLNLEIGQTKPNLVIAKVGTGGKISIYNHAGTCHYVGDVLGYMGPAGTGRHFALPAARLLDTTASGAGGAMTAASTRVIQVLGAGGVPASGVQSVVLNITALNPSAVTFMTAWPNGEARPVAANLNAIAGSPASNLAIVKVGTSGRVQLYNNAGTTNVHVDVVGYFGS